MYVHASIFEYCGIILKSMGTVSYFVDLIVSIQNMFVIHSECLFKGGGVFLKKEKGSANIKIAFSPFLEPWIIDDTLLLDFVIIQLIQLVYQIT